MVQKIMNNDMTEAAAKKVAVIDFSAVWCGPCKMLAPVLDEIAEEMGAEVSFYNIDVDENPDLAGKYGVMNIPTLLILKNGEEAARSVGFQPKQQLAAWIEGNK